MLKHGVATISSWCAADKPQCVVVEANADGVTVRDSKAGDGSPVLSFTREEWDAFTAGVRAGEFDLDVAAFG